MSVEQRMIVIVTKLIAYTIVYYITQIHHYGAPFVSKLILLRSSFGATNSSKRRIFRATNFQSDEFSERRISRATNFQSDEFEATIFWSDEFSERRIFRPTIFLSDYFSE